MAHRWRNIMADRSDISHRIRDLQTRVFRIALDPLRHGLTLKIIAADSGIPYGTLRTYADGSAIMPISALHQLCGVIPDELLSIRKGEVAQKHLDETATVMRYLIDSETSTEARLCKHLDRLNSAIVHQIDAIRTQISYHKAQARP